MCEPADDAEIEVTPEMIEAGLSILLGYSPDWSAEDAVADVFLVMERVRRRAARLDTAAV